MTPDLDVDDGVLDRIREHVDTEHEREVGGFLVGTIDEGSVTVQASIAALRAVGHRAQVTFTHEVWDEALEEVDRDHPGHRIVGWYHSHPGFGIFLSEYDRFIHRNFFSLPEMVALVVDPQSGEHGWFGWVDSDEIERFAGSPEASSEEPAATPVAAARPSRRGAVLAAAMVAVVSFAGGYGLAMRDTPTTVAGPEAETPAAPADDVVPEPGEPRIEDEVPGDAAGDGGAEESAGDEDDPSETSEPTQFTYQVRAGDTLSQLAWSFFDDLGAYAALLEANPDIDDPDVLHVGQVLRVPVEPLDGDP